MWKVNIVLVSLCTWIFIRTGLLREVDAFHPFRLQVNGTKRLG